MVTFTEVFGAGHFLISEANGMRSREQGVLKSGEDLAAGAVVAAEESGATATSAAVAGNTGNGAMGAVTVGDGAKVGVYTLTIVEPAANAGAFVVEDPDGVVIGNGDVAAAFAAGGLSFTLADGATDFAAGDQFKITVTTSTIKYIEYDPASGVANIAGILWDAVDASAADTDCVVIVRDAEVNAEELTWISGATTQQKTDAKTEMAKRLGIVSRASSSY